MIEASSPELIPNILAFVREIGIPVHERSLPEETFMEGIAIRSGELIVDRYRLKHPGDVLHEAGHMAIAPESERKRLDGLLNPHGGQEMAAIAWSYAAVVHLDISPTILFHEDGYAGDRESYLENFISGRYFGVPLLQWYGMAWEKHDDPTEPVFPSMRTWVRITEARPGETHLG